MDYDLLQRLGLEARATTGARGDAVELGAHVDYGKQQLYVAERSLTDATGASSQATVLGAETALGQKGTAYTEYQFGRFTGGIRNQTLLGVRQRWTITDGLSLLTAGEHTRLAATPEEATREALALGLDTNHRGPRRRATTKCGASAAGRAAADGHEQPRARPRRRFSLLGKHRYSYTEDPTSPAAGRFLGRSAGAAFVRPTTIG